MTSWRWEHVLDGAHAGLCDALAAIELEQAVRGLDAQDELDLHPLLAAGLASAGYGVHREQRYPSERGKSRRSEGRRCDLVITPESLPLFDERAQLELFRPARACHLGDALWLEVKTVAQFVEAGGNPAWSSALGGPLWRDVKKLATDEGIRHAALLVVLFTGDQAVADHDLAIWLEQARKRGLTVAEPHLRGAPVNDRLGNKLLTTALFPIVRV